MTANQAQPSGHHDYEYDYLVFIGRFQPYHFGHQRVVDEALRRSQNLVIVIGSSDCSRSLRNPWTFDERVEMIRASLSEADKARTFFVKQVDYLYDDTKWVKSVQESIRKVIFGARWQAGPYRIGLIGRAKDKSSFYLKLFPTWDSVPANNEWYDQINATDIRLDLFLTRHPESVFRPGGKIPPGTNEWLQKWVSNDHRGSAYHYVWEEAQYAADYKARWEVAPYPPTFVTSDAVVVQSGHILLVKRRACPGQGLYALPGGFLDQDERVLDGAVRELYEETKLKVPEPVLRGSFVKSKVYDDPFRSSRGRVITHAHLFKLKDDVKLPKVKGGSDANSAEWVPLGDLQYLRSYFFEDHADIIEDILG